MWLLRYRLRPGELEKGNSLEMADPRELLECGQSYWLDNLTREMLDSGELEENVRRRGLRGMTSNPKIFDEAISGGKAYDSQIRELVLQDMPTEVIYETLALTDVRRACDVFRPVYEESSGTDGFVSLEVSPYLAYDSAGTMEEARRLFAEVARPNVMIKIPGTAAGLDAVEEMLFEGVNVNITLLFGIERYQAVAERYLRALERRVRAGQSVDRLASVASFFLSRIDVLTDKLLGQRIVPGIIDGRPPETLFGELAIANAKLAYQSFLRIFSGERWQALADEGASVQRLLWASTSTKNPCYSDVKYVEPLIGRATVNTMPRGTIEAFADHGVARKNTIEEDLEAAELVFRELAAVGIDVRAVTWQLEHEGVEKFVKPMDDLISSLARKRLEMSKVPRQELGDHVPRGLDSIEAALQQMQLGRGLRAKNPWLWTKDPAEAERIRDRLGWIDSAESFRARAAEIRDFALDARERFDRVLLLGMGGSSLTASVSRDIFGSAAGFLELRVLDSTHPTEVARAKQWTEGGQPLFIVASKSGTTTETLSLYRYFRDQARERGGAGARFVAITDAGSPLAREAREAGFARVFENPPDMGGRYSALSYVGLLPMALIGVDIETLLFLAQKMKLTGDGVPVGASPASTLGAFLAAAANEGRNKITFVPGGGIDGFYPWLEQLLAESTGKKGQGLVPILDEPLGDPDVYGNDRTFVSLFTRERGHDRRLESLEAAGHPVVRIELREPLEIGAEFLRWETAVAAAGMVLGINPFDQPDVEASKENTRRLLEEWESSGVLAERNVLVAGEEIQIHADEGQPWIQSFLRNEPISAFLESFFALGRPGETICLLPYLPFTAEHHKQLQILRFALRDRTRLATMLGYGPRYLHSTGQLFKGGPDAGLFLILTAGESEESGTIPGTKYGFKTLLDAQALGDFRALNQRGRRAIRIHFRKGIDSGLDELITALVSEAKLSRA